MTGILQSLAKPPTGAAIFNMGKGVIIDSGTTATYLPAFLLRNFQDIFKSITGFDYTGDKPISLSPFQIRKIPNLVWTFEGINNNFLRINLLNKIPFLSTGSAGPVIVRMPFSNFIDSDGGGMYTFKVLLTEGSGTVLGANFMSGYNMIFDVDGHRVGFAESGR